MDDRCNHGARFRCLSGAGQSRADLWLRLSAVLVSRKQTPVRDARLFGTAYPRRSGLEAGHGADRRRREVSRNLAPMVGGSRAVRAGMTASLHTALCSPDAAPRAPVAAWCAAGPGPIVRILKRVPAVRSSARAPHRFRDTKVHSAFSLKVARNGWPG